MTLLDLSVVICTHTDARWQYLLDAVESVRNQRTPPREIIVVVDHNPTLRERIQAQIPGVRVVENQEPKGASGAKNSGVAAATSRLIAFLDDDATAESDWLEILGASLSDSNVLGVGGFTAPQWPQGRPRWFPEEFDWVVGGTHRGMPETNAPIRNLIACNMVVRREVFESFGGFRHGIGPAAGRPLGCEETEFCIRVGKQSPGKVWLHNVQAKAHHQVPLRRTTWGYFVQRCYGEGLSKALVANLVGSQIGLATERAYVVRTLPLGVLRGLRDFIFHFDIGGLGRAMAIVLGLAVTTFGYLKGRLTMRVQADAVLPILVGAFSKSENTG